ncbi:MAG: hypothetical protein IPO01_00265 [Chitinophagaceae bacterium]|nr:hypothetical protein [Chitinophagaceae bacterium]
MSKFLRSVLAIVVAFTVHQSARSQSLSINTSGNPANASSILDVESTDKGMLIPRMNKTQKNAIAAPATGLLIFQNAPDSIGFHYYNGTAWIWLPGSNNVDTIAWKTNGNTGTIATNNFIGTRDNVALSFRQNNTWLGRWNSISDNYFIGDSSGSFISSGISNTGYGAKTLFANTSAFANVAVGNYALQNNTSGSRNTAVGDSALYTQSYNPGGNYFSDNTAIGNKAMFANQPTSSGNGIKNTAIGNEALFDNTTGSQNTAIGVSALRENITGNANTAVGRSAHRQSKSGSSNSYFGFETGYADSTGSENTGIGTYALHNHQTGDRNTGIGYYALAGDTSGNYNTGLGAYTSFTADTANLTTAAGYAALYYNKRDYNTALGAYAGFQNSRSSTNITQGIENTVIGYAAATGNAFGSQNTIIGYKAMSIFEPNTSFSGTAPSRNVAVGDSALKANRGNDNVGIGYRALSNTNNVGMDGHVAIGSRALMNTTATFPNTAVGYSSMDSATTATGNTAMGSYSLTAMKTGVNNTAIGNAAMFEAVGTGTNLQQNTAVGRDALRVTRYFGNTGIGSQALRNDTAGSYNSALGYQAMFDNLSGDFNAAFGYQASLNNETGSNNTSIGATALDNNTTGSDNTAVGYNANVSTGALTNATAIGANAFVTNNNSLVLGSVIGANAATASTNVGIGTTTPRARLHVVKDGEVGGGLIQTFSAAVIENNAGTNYLQLLNPVTGDAGLISGTSATTVRGGLLFYADSSLGLLSGGGITRMSVENNGFVGVRTTTALSYFDVNGSSALAGTTTTADLTLNEFHHTVVILSTTAAGAGDIVLPTASTCPRREYVIVNQTAVNKTISSYDSFTGAASTVIPATSSITVQSIGGLWYRTK